MTAVDKLLSIGGGALAPVSGQLGAGIGAASEILSLLQRCNGFFAFESALHVFHSGADVPGLASIETWNDRTLWISDYDQDLQGLTFFAEDIFGNQFAASTSGILGFDAETGDLAEVAPSLEEWAMTILADYEVQTGSQIAHSWQAEFGALPIASRLVPRIPFICGGAFTPANLFPYPREKSMKLRAGFARQIRNLPDGSKIKFIFEP